MVSWFVIVYTGSSFIGHFHNIAGVAISSAVCNYLSAAIRKKDTVGTAGSITITTFGMSIVEFGVVVNDSVIEIVFGGSIGRFLVGWCWMVDWSWVVNWGGCMVGNGNSQEGKEGNEGLKMGQQICIE